MDNCVCKNPSCKAGDLLAEADPNCPDCRGTGTVVEGR